MNKKMRTQRPWRWERKEIFKRDFASGSDSTPDAHTQELKGSHDGLRPLALHHWDSATMKDFHREQRKVFEDLQFFRGVKFEEPKEDP